MMGGRSRAMRVSPRPPSRKRGLVLSCAVESRVALVRRVTAGRTKQQMLGALVAVCGIMTVNSALAQVVQVAIWNQSVERCLSAVEGGTKLDVTGYKNFSNILGPENAEWPDDAFWTFGAIIIQQHVLPTGATGPIRVCEIQTQSGISVDSLAVIAENMTAWSDDLLHEGRYVVRRTRPAIEGSSQMDLISVGKNPRGCNVSLVWHVNPARGADLTIKEKAGRECAVETAAGESE